MVLGRKAQLRVFSGLSAFLFVATAILALQVLLKLEEVLADPPTAMAHSVAKIEVQQVRLRSAINDLPTGGADDVRRIFAALRGSVFSVESDDAHDGLEEASAAIKSAHLQELTDLLAQMRPMIDGPDTALVDSKAELLRMADAMTHPIQTLEDISFGPDQSTHQAERDALAQQLILVTFLSLALLVAVLSLLLLLWQLYRLYRRRALENHTILNRLTTILNTSQDAVLVVSTEGRILDTNRAADEVFFDTAPTAGVQIETILLRKEDGDELRPVTGEMLMKACAHGPKICARLVVRCASGAHLPVELSADIGQLDDQPVVICFLRNIAQRIADQTELLAARDSALSGERTKARFLSMISHEMRTPLNGLLGTLDLLEKTELTAQQARYLSTLQKTGRILLDQTNDVLDIAEANQGGLQLRPEPFDMEALVGSLVRSQMEAAKAQGNQLNYRQRGGRLGFVMGDPQRVRQVLLNLLSNAIKFTKDGQVTLETRRKDEQTVEIVLSDTGIGVSQEDQSRIFEDFVRLDAARALSVEGSGLGLGIVRHLVALMGGEITMESAAGSGSTFRLRLPLSLVKVTPRALPAPAPVRRAAETPVLDVLIVEDNPTNRDVLQEMLVGEGHRTWVAKTGAEGVEQAERQRFDLILMDISMPVLDGVAAAKLIRDGKGPSRNSRIIALSAHLNEEVEARPEFDETLIKPLRHSTLLAILDGEPAPEHVPSPWDTRHLSQLSETLGATRLSGMIDRFETDVDAALRDVDVVPERQASLFHELAGAAATLGARQLHEALAEAQSSVESGTALDADALRQIWQLTRAARPVLNDAA